MRIERNYFGPGRYRHYKGGEYEVIGVALTEATLSPVVVYHPVDSASLPYFMSAYDATMWTRPLHEFNQEVSSGTEGESVPRFKKVT